MSANRKPKRKPLGPGRGAEPWPDEIKKRALELAAEKGLAEASRETGVPYHTIKLWRRKAGQSSGRPTGRSALDPEGWAERKQKGAEETWERARDALDLVRTRLADGEERKAKDAALTMAILIDKSAVLEQASALADQREAKLAEAQGELVARLIERFFADVGLAFGPAGRKTLAYLLRGAADGELPEASAPEAEKARAEIRRQSVPQLPERTDERESEPIADPQDRGPSEEEVVTGEVVADDAKPPRDQPREKSHDGLSRETWNAGAGPARVGY